jgi:LAS superfamily LD-carboxypeptidase LdcB
LTPEEREREILQASAAPGLSRHHWGSDFDLLDPNLDPASWQRGSQLWLVYRWLRDQAIRYGFVDPFRVSTSPSTGYTQERWHWSYWPLSQVLLEFARANEVEVERGLDEVWGKRPQFSFVRRHWRGYLLEAGRDVLRVRA